RSRNPPVFPYTTLFRSRTILLDFRRKKEQLSHCLTIADVLMQEGDLSSQVQAISQQEKTKDSAVKEIEDEGVEKDTKAISLDLFLEGVSVEDIAQKRGMVVGTIYGHLIHFVGNEVEAEDLIERTKLEVLLDVLRKNEGNSASEIKMILGDDYSYPDIKLGQKVLEVALEK